MSPHRVVVDANIPDFMYQHPAAREAMRSAVTGGSVELLVDAVVIDQVSKIGTGISGTADKRQTCVEIVDELCTTVPMSASVFGFGPFGEGPFGGSPPEQQPIVRAVVGNTTSLRGGTHRDAIIAATAHRQQAALATSDPRLIKIARRMGIEVLTPYELFHLVGFDLAAAEAAGTSDSTS